MSGELVVYLVLALAVAYVAACVTLYGHGGANPRDTSKRDRPADYRREWKP